MTKSQYTSEYEHLRLLIVAERERAGMTQVELSAKLGRPQSFVSKIESGERRIDVVELIDLCKALGADPLVIINDIMTKGRR